MTKRWLFTAAASNSQKNAKLLEMFSMTDYLYEYVNVPAKEVSGKTSSFGMIKQNHVVSAAGALLRISKEWSYPSRLYIPFIMSKDQIVFGVTFSLTILSGTTLLQKLLFAV